MKKPVTVQSGCINFILQCLEAPLKDSKTGLDSREDSVAYITWYVHVRELLVGAGVGRSITFGPDPVEFGFQR